MNIINKLSPATKMIILIFYTIVIAAISITIINAVSLDETKGYISSPKDENIQVVAKLYESRTITDKEDRKEEKASWTLFFQVLQHNSNVKVKDIELFTKARTESGKTIYFEKSNANVSTNNKAFATLSNKIQKSCTYTSNKYDTTDTELTLVYTTVRYTVTIDENTQSKEFKYYFVPGKVEQFDFENIKNTSSLKLNGDKIELNDKNNYLNIKLNNNLPIHDHDEEDPNHDHEHDLSNEIGFELKANEEVFAKDEKYVKNAHLTVYGKVKNSTVDKEEFLENYITVIDLHGVFVDKNNTAWNESSYNTLSSFYNSNCSINTSYNVSELYAFVSYTLSDGSIISESFKINLTK